MTVALTLNPALLAALDPLTVAMGVLGFGSVVLLVVSVFGHSERPEISPQRQVAIAMGQGDRRTIFESALLGPLIWPLLHLARKLAAVKLKARLRRMLVAAGSPNFYTAEEFLAIALLWALLCAALLVGLNHLAFGSSSLVALVVGLALGGFLPIYLLRDKAGKRTREIGRRVPYTLDLIALAMGAGSSFTEAVRTVVREDREHPMNVELATLLAEIELGATRKTALLNLSDRVPLESLRSIVASVIQAEELGTALGDVLKSQSSLLRLHRSVRAEKMAALASVRILIPSVLILLSVVLTVFAPFIVLAVRRALF